MTTICNTTLIQSPASTVWKTLTDTDLMKQWMSEPEMNIEIQTDWSVGGSILISGFHHVQFENKGTVLQFEPDKILSYTHLNSVSRLPDIPESYTTIEFILTPVEKQTSLSVTLSNFPTETIFKHLDFYWRTTIELIKNTIEKHYKIRS